MAIFEMQHIYIDTFSTILFEEIHTFTRMYGYTEQIVFTVTTFHLYVSS